MVGKYVDAAGGSRGSIPKWKGLASLDWTATGGVNAGLQMNYVPHLFAGLDNERTDLDASGTYDVYLGYDFAQASKFTLGANNVTDKMPPSTDPAFNDNIDARTHNLIGRFYYARYGIQL